MKINKENNTVNYEKIDYPLFDDTDITEDVLQHHIDVAKETLTEYIKRLADDNETVVEH